MVGITIRQLRAMFINMMLCHPQDKQARQTRQKMDQFFARLETTMNQPNEVNTLKTRPNTPVKRSNEEPMTQDEEQKDYRTATPWPVRIWC